MGRNGAVLGAGLLLSAIMLAAACGESKPPLTPDDEHANMMGTDPPGIDAGGTPAPPAMPAPSPTPANER